MSMTGKERAALRAEAHHLDVKVHIGHQGATPALVASVDDKVHLSKPGDEIKKMWRSE